MSRKNGTANHEKFMLEAIRLAAKGEGAVSPNPMVGAVIVKGGRVVGRGWHKFYGGKHAEANAIENAGKKASRGGTIYVTLEPCNHYGKQPPCTKAIIEAGIHEVFYACADPDKGSLHGAAELRKHGISTHYGLCKKEAEKQNEFYIKSLAQGRPFIALKSAMTSDGFITYGNGKHKRISGGAAKAFTQSLRKKFDAILVGVNTIIKDNPRLTYRKNPGFNPTRIILDSAARSPPRSRVFSEKGATIVVCTAKANAQKIRKLEERGTAVIIAKESNGQVDLHWLAKALFEINIRSVIVEGGQRTSTAFLEAGLFDRIYIIIAQRALKNGLKAFAPKKSIEVKAVEAKSLGRDTLVVLEKK